MVVVAGGLEYFPQVPTWVSLAVELALEFVGALLFNPSEVRDPGTIKDSWKLLGI